MKYLQIMIDFFDNHSAAIIAFTSFMGWICTVWSDRKLNKKLKGVLERIHELVDKDNTNRNLNA